MNKKLLPAIWFLAIAAIVLLSSLLKLESTHFFGIADDREQTISFSYPVEIVQTSVVEGGEVKQGTQILEVRRHDLGTKLVIIKDQIQAVKSTSDEERASTRAQLEGLRAQQAAELSKIDAQINTLRSQQLLNEKLLRQISGSGTKISSKSPLQAKIKGLQEERGHIEISLTAQIENLQSQLNASVRPADSKLAELKERETEFQRQLTDLKVLAKFNGSVGSVNYKPGEMVEPFQPILTIHGLSPQFVKGYIHENVFNQVAIGQKVWVQSNTNTNTAESEAISAIVESLGSRIVEYPIRLKKNMMVSAWGREAVIRLTENNFLLLGEKVVVSLTEPAKNQNLMDGLLSFFSSSISESLASSRTGAASETEGFPIKSLINDLQDEQIELSGLIKASNPDYYFIVSNESTAKTPALYKLNTQGEIIQLLTIHNKKSVNELKTISSPGDDIYVLAPLDNNKQKRHQLSHLQLTDEHVVLDGHINLYQLLIKLSKTSHDVNTRQFLKQALQEDTIQIEAHAIHQDDLYVGLKAPLNQQGETVFIKFDNIDQLFMHKPLSASGEIWRSIALLDPQTGAPSHLSDMLFFDNKLLLLGRSDNQSVSSSHLWSYQYTSSSLTALQSFGPLKAKGISATSKQGEIMLVFDGNGKQPSRFLPVALNEQVSS
ncbi:MAG: HlyD family efflux transporter periplasmic adaptor subunit [Gammaproteobacteria bacterium]|nr:HlyD family efflux transporter periplasmic adaptor subunit [Gammaproteobacteria bacterium]MBT3722766.1 HlyD family efflux transporter periplasmic adaptor subunit [Gammaproteobacteria bacterium]MBT4195388.1 HlyD family efflux transporter periplasmic adaptor subunit [Gammaproteobacteria bacterium]MBT4448102.1 HlyD family efflux transporter periplasmic adaptor subunit [Gammaproteobacteria bacterium]MBT4860418.1 HlyD family efflux transporter periplasmic adaptor subunit [Gammaproteobacteria bact